MDMLPDQSRGGKFTGSQEAIKCQSKGCPEQPFLHGEIFGHATVWTSMCGGHGW